MNMKTKIIATLAGIFIAPVAQAQNYDDVIEASLITGWRQADGSHMSGIRLELKTGWHTYWRAPGDAGIPPSFDLSDSRNLKAAQIVWPRPEVYEQNGLRSIVYHDQVVLPLQVAPKTDGKDIQLNARIEIGVCKDICIPQTLNISAILPADSTKRDGRIAASLADRAYSGKEAGAQNVRCRISPDVDGITLQASLELPRVGKGEAMIIEAANPLLWIAQPKMTRSGNTLTAVTQIQHVENAPFLLNRSSLRITVLSDQRAVEIVGCKGS